MGRFLKSVATLGTAVAQSITIPKGSSANRPTTPRLGDFRFNTDTSMLEYYDGNQFRQSAKVGEVSLVLDSFTGDNSTTTFQMSQEVSGVNQIMVFIGGVHQDPDTAYTVLLDEITFTSAPPTDEPINVLHNIGSTDAS